ncbi:MAG: Maltose/maltodextrin import ATP-binding protein MalK [Chloroflexi bacterium]|nr:Maltose/maltodextrin import ATP-binding protein MalK [Chloroflexota bacterium]
MDYIQLQNLEIKLGEFHLRDINLVINEGEYFVILGPTGAGKTVLLESMAGLLSPRRGRVFLGERDITDLPPEQRKVGFVYQDYALFPHLNVAENIGFGLRTSQRSVRRPSLSRHKKKNEHVNRQVEEMGQLLSIDHLLHRDPTTLSGGEQQRVALARALIVNPHLLLLDEPLSALDPGTREGLQRELARVHRELGTTTLQVTHDFEEAVALADRIAVMQEGRIVQVGTPEDIFRRPATPSVARFVGARNVFAGHIEEEVQDGHKSFRVNGLRFAVVTPLSGPAHASLRPEDIILSAESLRSSARNSFPGVVGEIADRGAFLYVTVRINSLAQVPGTCRYASRSAGDLGGTHPSSHPSSRSPHPHPNPRSACPSGIPQGEGTGLGEEGIESPPCFICMITHRSLEEMALEKGSQVHMSFKASAVHVF